MTRICSHQKIYTHNIGFFGLGGSGTETKIYCGLIPNIEFESTRTNYEQTCKPEICPHYQIWKNLEKLVKDSRVYKWKKWN